MAKKVITGEFKAHNVNQFIESVDEVANTLYFVCALKSTAYDDEANTPSFSVTSESLRHAYREILFGKKVIPEDVKAMVARHNWTANTAYSQFDDTDADLSSKEFFVVSTEAGSYHVFKCLDNNSNAYSISQPLESQTSANDAFYETADGYLWKFLYSISSPQMTKFGTNSLIPVIENANVTSNAITGTIDSYWIVDSGQNLNNYCNGTFETVSVAGNTQVHKITSTNFVLSGNDNFYANTTIYIDSGKGMGQSRLVTGYYGANSEIVLETAFDTAPDATSTFKIAPRVRVRGDGSGAIAILNVNTSANSISTIDVINRGSGYTYANVEIVANTGSANVRPIIAPHNGHGSELENELFASKFSISLEFSNNEANAISTDLSFRRIAILEDPLFANVQVTLAGTSAFLVGETISQANTNASGVVVSNSNNVVQVTNAYGFFSNTSADTITGETSGETNTPTAVTINNFSDRVFENRHKYTVELTHSGTGGTGFEVGEEVTQTGTDASGYVSEVSLQSGSIYTIYLTEVKGTFDISTALEDKTFVGANTSSVGKITAHVAPALVEGSGDIIYVENVDPVTRALNQNERINIILGF